MDNPSSLKRFPDNLMKCLVWVFYHYFTLAAANGQQNVSSPQDLQEPVNGAPAQRNSCDSGEAKDGRKGSSKDAWTLETSVPEPVTQKFTNKELDTLSWTESISSIDNMVPAQTYGLDTATTIFSLDAVDSLPGLIPQDRPADKPCHTAAATTTIDDFSQADKFMRLEVRLSAVPASKKSRVQQVGDLELAVLGKTEIPQRWTERLPALSQSQFRKIRSKFPVDWLEFLITLEDENSLSTYLREKLMDLVIVCFALADVGTSSHISGRRAEETKPFDIFEGFCGRFPYSIHSDWFSEDQLLNELLLKAYRYQ